MSAPHDWIVPDWPAPPNVRSLVTTRSGGVSTGPYAGLNLGSHVADEPAAVECNRRLLAAHLPSEPAWLEQVHGTEVVSADDPTASRCGDGVVARQAGAVCAVMTADCLPVLFCDDAGAVVAAAHAGWRGLLGGVLERTVESMQVPPGQIQAWLGPAIGPQAFEVGGEVRDAFCAHAQAAEEAFAAGERPGKWLADIYLLARQRLHAAGVMRISGGGECTVADAGRFYSYRRDGVTGRFASLVWIDPLAARRY